MRPVGTAHALEAVRRHALILAGQGLSRRAIAHAVGRDPRSVHRWLKTAAADPAALRARPAPGRPTSSKS